MDEPQPLAFALTPVDLLGRRSSAVLRPIASHDETDALTDSAAVALSVLRATADAPTGSHRKNGCDSFTTTRPRPAHRQWPPPPFAAPPGFSRARNSSSMSARSNDGATPSQQTRTHDNRSPVPLTAHTLYREVSGMSAHLYGPIAHGRSFSDERSAALRPSENTRSSNQKQSPMNNYQTEKRVHRPIAGGGGAPPGLRHAKRGSMAAFR